MVPDRVIELVTLCGKRPGAARDVRQRMTQTLGVSLPDDYFGLLEYGNGVEGFVGENYLSIWPIEEVPAYQGLCEAMPFDVFFGSNGAGEGYAYDMRTSPPPIVNVPFIGMEEKLIRVLGHSILEFFERLARAPLFP